MRWSAWQSMRVGAQVLSGTSLALAVGCAGGEPAKAERMQPMSLAAIEQVEEAAQAARRKPRYETETALASTVTPEVTPASPASGSEPWFLRPAGQAQPGFTPEQPVSVSNQSVSPSSQVNVVPERPRPQPVVQPIQRRPPGWRRAACGRG